MSCYFPRCPRCQEKPIIRNAISYIYLSLSPPASSSRLPTRPAEPPSPSGHTSLLLTPVTTCPSLAPQRSLPEPLRSGLHGRMATFLLVCQGVPTCASICTGQARGWCSSPKPRAGRGASGPVSRSSFPDCQSLGSAGLSPESSTSRSAGSSGRGAPTEVSPKRTILERREAQGERTRRGEVGGSSQACEHHAAG